MPTQTKENYLKAIYFLELKERPVTVTDLGEEMNVSKSTVTSMIKKLSSKGWIKYEKYKPIRLSKKGRKEAALIVRKHRLTEMFLVEVMRFGWEEVHNIAEEMEHLKSEKFFDRMDELLGSPQFDPHGSPIPGKSGMIIPNDYKPMTEHAVDTNVILRAVADNTDSLLVMLNEKKIKLGTAFTIRKVEQFDKSMVVDYENSNGVVLSFEVCRRLLVEKQI